jgi:membrane fusion protein (multidrug efflux system)
MQLDTKRVVGIGVMFGLLAVTAGGVAWWRHWMNQSAVQQQMPEMPTAVVTVSAERTAWRPTARLVGNVVAKRSVMVSNELAGVVEYVGFDSGVTVDAGEELLRLDATSERADLVAAQAAVRLAEAALEVAQANVKVAEVDVRFAQAELERNQQASQSAAVARSDVDRAAANLDRARADMERERATVQRVSAELDQSRARVTQVQAQIAKKTIRAPFQARAGIRSTHPGQYLAEGSQVVALQEITPDIFLDFAIPQEQISRVKVGDAVQAVSEVLGAEPVTITVSAIDATVDSGTRNVRVRGVVDNSAGRLKPGMFVDISVPVGDEQRMLTVPSTAVRRASFGDHVFMVGPDPKDPAKQRARQRLVKLGPAVGNRTIVLSGLNEGDKVAADGSFKLFEGALVAEVPAGGATGGPAGSAAPGAGEPQPTAGK